MSEVCTPGTYADETSPVSKKQGIFTNKQSPLTSKLNIFAKKDSATSCFKNLVAHLLQESGGAILLAEGGYIKL